MKHRSIFCLCICLLLTANAWGQERKTTVNPPELMDTRAFGFSQATIVPSDARLIFTAGQIGISDFGPNDFEDQMDRSFENLRIAVETAGGAVESIVKITLLVKDIDEEKLNLLIAKRREFFGENPPASTLIPVPALALPSLEFEIDAIAIARQKGDTP